MDSNSDTFWLNDRSAWATSTDSSKLSVPGATGGMDNGVEAVSDKRIYQARMSQGNETTPHTYLLGSLALDGHKNDAFPTLWILQVESEIRTAQHSKLDIAIHDQRETDCVLFASQESLGAVDGIQRPPA